MSDLRAKRSAQTRSDIFEAALRLFHERGFDDTTMQDVADAAGVSRRTAYRFFPSKDDLVFEPPRQWVELYAEILESRQPGESARDLITRALLVVAEHIQEDRERVVSAFQVLLTSSSLASRHTVEDQRWIDLTVDVILAGRKERSEGAKALVFQKALIAGTTLNKGNFAMIGLWASRPDLNMPDLAVLVLEQLDSIWP